MKLNDMTRTRLFVGLETAENHASIAPEEVINFIKDRVSAGTFYESKGLWMGELENSLVFECMDLQDNIKPAEDQDHDMMKVRALQDLKEGLEEEFNQDSVMIEQTGVEVSF